jgi:hypothetical protein
MQYFYITDQAEARWVHIQHCSTEDMISNFFTKTPQGTQFRCLCALVMNFDLNIPLETPIV